MKVKIKQIVLSTALFFVGFFILESCTKEAINESDLDAIENVEESTSRSTDYCRYRVVDPIGPPLPFLQPGDIVCLPCNAPCTKWVNDYPVYDQNGNQIASFVGRAMSPNCSSCGNGTILN